ncbi:MAG: TolC family protein [Myxococcota bacterium]
MRRLVLLTLLGGLWLGTPSVAYAEVLDVESAVRRARSRAPSIRVQEATVDAASHSVDASEQWLNPEVRIGVDIPDGDPSDARMEGAIRFKLEHPAERKRRRLEREATRAGLAADLASSRASIERTIRSLYAEHAHARAEAELAQRRAELMQARATLMKTALSLGRATPAEVRRAQVQVTAARARHRRLRRDVDHIEIETAALLGLPESQLRADMRSALPRLASLPSDDDLVRDALARSPSLVERNATVDATRSSIRAERAKVAPWLDFFQAGRTFPSRERPGGYEVVAGFTIPIFSLNRRGIDAARAKHNAARVQRDAARDALAWKVRQLATAARDAEDDARAFRALVDAYDADVAAADPLESNELALDQLDAEEDALAAHATYALAVAGLQAVGALGD